MNVHLFPHVHHVTHLVVPHCFVMNKEIDVFLCCELVLTVEHFRGISHAMVGFAAMEDARKHVDLSQSRVRDLYRLHLLHLLRGSQKQLVHSPALRSPETQLRYSRDSLQPTQKFPLTHHSQYLKSLLTLHSGNLRFLPTQINQHKVQQSDQMLPKHPQDPDVQTKGIEDQVVLSPPHLPSQDLQQVVPEDQ